LEILTAIDLYVSQSQDPRLSWVAIVHVFGLNSTKGLTVPQIAEQLGCTEAAFRHAVTKFRKLAESDFVSEIPDEATAPLRQSLFGPSSIVKLYFPK
jgi:hypothetical protein